MRSDFCPGVLIFVLFLQLYFLIVAGIIIKNSQVLQEPRIRQQQQQSASFTTGALRRGIHGNSNLEDDMNKENDNSAAASHLVFPGGGIFFYWQAGVVSYLREQKYDLSSCTFSGASAGALTATLTATNVDFYEATELALNLAARAKVWDRSSGLQGIWGEMIYEWLDALLPDDEMLDSNLEGGRLSLLVTPIPTFGKNCVSHFGCKEDLIRCNLASVHIPWFMDGKITYAFRDAPHIDGSFLSRAEDYMPKQQRHTIILDWSEDPVMESCGGLDIVEALSPDGIWGLIKQGKEHATILEDRGTFKVLEKAS